ncbi:MAG: cytochrome c oxidase subunit 3 [Spirosomaceae bacterium]|jgi:cytochrome c oxidase subunit 3|nr:cytochrome c oxidase subunit 3 [Spirosomataceae bacterium]
MIDLSKRREPFEFMLYLAMIGSGILFLGVMFFLIAKETINNLRVSFIIPKFFWFSTFAILLSSATLHWSIKAFNEERFRSYRLNIIVTSILGVFFIALQFLGWGELLQKNIRLGNNTGGEFIYILSGLHIFHTIGGLIALLVMNRDAIKNLNYVDTFVYSVNPPNQLKIRLISVYWHFIDILWVLLFLFLLYHAT